MKIPVEKEQAIRILEEIAVLLELKDANVFKIRAFQNAASVLEGAPQDLHTLIETGELEKLKGIGKGISKVLRDLYETGHSPDHEDLRKGIPATLFELFRIPGLGAKRVKVLYEKLKIKSLEDLKKACETKKLETLDGFGAKIQEKILQGIANLSKASGQFLLAEAREAALKVVEHLKKVKGITKIEIAGSLRRFKEVVKDIDVLVSAKDPVKVHDALLSFPGARQVAHGDTKSSITLASGINCDLRTVTEKEFPYALYYFTGSKEHNVATRTLAKKKNIKINEYGLYRGNRLIACESESDIFKALGLRYVPPEARENTGEVEWVLKKDFPALVVQKDLRGVFHVHSEASDGTATLENMVRKAESMGFEYVGISDHSQSAKYAGGLDPARVRSQWREIDLLQKKVKIRIFKGIESDILADGALDYSEDVLAGFDFVIGSVHSKFNLPEREMTERLVRAMQNKHLTFIGHPTGRLLLKRAGYSLDMNRFIDTAKKTGVVIELNSNPNRLDLDWRICRQAKERGVLLSINPDAHSMNGMEDIFYGVGTGRKAWLEKKDVVNTLPLAAMEKFLKQRK